MTRVCLKIIFALFLNCFFQSSKALPEGPFPDSIFRNNIKTVQLYEEGWEFSYPILKMNGDTHLLFSFDDLDIQSKTYSYAIIHCDANWMASRVPFNEYMDGFFMNPLNDYQSSVSTHIPYVHYSLKIPNENIVLKISGNYALIIYENNDEEHPVLIKRFSITEDRITIDAVVKRPVLPVYQNAKQEIDFSVLYPDYAVDNPHESVKVAIVKNNQWLFSITDLVPLFIKDKELVYDFEDKNLFWGGNEYRTVDIKSLKYQSANIASIQNSDSGYHVILHPDKPRDNQGYFYNEDFNGKYHIENREGNQADIDAEYVKVTFNLESDPFIEGQIYVFGAFSDFSCKDQNLMNYDNEKNLFVTNLLLKQGYYNYYYMFKPKDDPGIDERYFENSFYETENDYVIYVYHRPYGSRYDHLVGVKIINSLIRTSSN